MANTDYITRGSGPIAPSAFLQVPIEPGDETFSIRLYSSQNSALPAVGDAVMIDDEIMVLRARTFTSITVGRGCADTVSNWHDPGAKIWFFGNATGSDRREYLAGETIGVKVLMKTSGGAMEARNAPPNEISFQGRASMPYPPAKVQCNDIDWWDDFTLDKSGDAELVFTWVERNRLTQADVLIDHGEDGVAAEAGTTYNLRFYDGSNTVLREMTGLTGLTATYTYAMAIADLDLTADDAAFVERDTWMFARLESVRGGQVSWQSYEIWFPVNTHAASGWGGEFGNNWGG